MVTAVLFWVGDIHAKGSSIHGQTGAAFPPCYQAINPNLILKF